MIAVRDLFNIEKLMRLKLEEKLRTGIGLGSFEITTLNDIFWQEIAIILIAYSYIKHERYNDLESLKAYCSSKPVLFFLNKRIEEFHQKISNEAI